MRPRTIIPLLALLANAARIPQDSHNPRQVHNADFSAVGPAAKGAITNTGSSRSPATFDPAPAPLSRRGRIPKPFDPRVISVAVGAESVSLANGDPIVQAREETGSDADIDVKRDSPHPPLATRDEKATKGVAWRQVDDDISPDDSVLDAGVSNDDGLVTRDMPDLELLNSVQVQAMLAQLDGICLGSRPSSPVSQPGKRMLSADKPVHVPIPGTATTASGGAWKHLARRGLLDSVIGLLPASGPTTANCESVLEILMAAGTTIHDYSLVALGSSPRIDVFPRNANPDPPALPVTPPSLPVAPPSLPVAPPSLPVAPPSLPVAPPSLPVGRDDGSASPTKLSSDLWDTSARKLVRTRSDDDLPDLSITPPVTPPIRRDTSVNGVSPPTVDSAGLVPRFFPFVSKEERF